MTFCLMMGGNEIVEVRFHVHFFGCLRTFRLVPAHVADNVVEISTNYAATLLLNVSNDVRWEDLNHGLGSHLVHGVVLVVASGKIGEHGEGDLVNLLDDGSNVLLEVISSQHCFQFIHLFLSNFPLPFKLALALGNHWTKV